MKTLTITKISARKMPQKRSCSLKTISEQTGYSVEELTGTNRGEMLCINRFLCFACLRRNKNKTLTSIGHKFNRNHATVINGINKLDEMKHNKKRLHPKLIKAMNNHKCFEI